MYILVMTFIVCNCATVHILHTVIVHNIVMLFCSALIKWFDIYILCIRLSMNDLTALDSVCMFGVLTALDSVCMFGVLTALDSVCMFGVLTALDSVCMFGVLTALDSVYVCTCSNDHLYVQYYHICTLSSI